MARPGGEPYVTIKGSKQPEKCHFNNIMPPKRITPLNFAVTDQRKAFLHKEVPFKATFRDTFLRWAEALVDTWPNADSFRAETGVETALDWMLEDSNLQPEVTRYCQDEFCEEFDALYRDEA